MYTQTRAGGPRDPRRAAELIRRLALEVPQRVVRVVGTNGKGTVTNMVAAGTAAAGYVTGRFLSPHVESFTERVAVNGVEVSPDQVKALVRRAHEASRSGGALDGLSDDLRPSFFEWTLALALTSFAAAQVDYAVMEAGVGGSLDATSAVVRSLPQGGPAAHAPGSSNIALVIITNVDLDHTETLGTTVRAIATEKAGAIEPGVPVVTGTAGAALEVVAGIARSRASPLYVDEHGAALFALPPGAAGTMPPTGTRAANARLAAAGLRLLGVPESAVTAGVNAAALPGRGERFSIRGTDVLLDGAHDPAAAARLLEEVEPGFVLLFGSLARKQGLATLAVLEGPA
ncbi:MAG TPA: hypothetical protein VKZ43_00560, partial [Trueperaceae bacterium]|nr:hypothetical protein [Trueperaceae bacterium]